jgi:hypothetical protein
MSPRWGSTPRLTDWLTVSRNVTLTVNLTLDVQNISSADTGISTQTEGHSFGDHLISKSVSVTPLSVIEASVVLCSVSL